MTWSPKTLPEGKVRAIRLKAATMGGWRLSAMASVRQRWQVRARGAGVGTGTRWRRWSADVIICRQPARRCRMLSRCLKATIAAYHQVCSGPLLYNAALIPVAARRAISGMGHIIVPGIRHRRGDGDVSVRAGGSFCGCAVSGRRWQPIRHIHDMRRAS